MGIWLCISWNGSAHAVEPVDRFAGLAASYVIEAQGKTLWAHQADRELPPASLTKIMTALLVLERSRPDDIVTVGADAVGETGSRMGLAAGERFRVRDLLAITLLLSANDACHALATHVAGNEVRFVAQMNRRAKEIGLNKTNFTNACGHDHPRHYSTAYDLARLTDIALKHALFLELVAMVQTTAATVDGKRTFDLVNSNELVGRYPGAIGVKTGYTQRAGKCLVALAQREDASVILVLLNAPDRWWSAVDMLDYAFAHLALVKSAGRL